MTTQGADPSPDANPASADPYARLGIATDAGFEAVQQAKQQRLREAGVKVWRYQPGFMHQKVLLADGDLAIVGSINLDYRSFMLNFELSAAVQDTAFASAVESMFLADFDRSRPEDLAKFGDGSLPFRLKCRLAALMSPEQ